MGFDTPQYPLSTYLEWTTSGSVQLPDFQREYKWEDERIRQLLVTVLRGHPMGAVMLLETGNDQVRFKPKVITGSNAPDDVAPKRLLLDGQQRLTSLTQALSGDGVVRTTDSRGKLVERKYFVDIALALESEDRLDEAVLSVPGDGIERENFGRTIVRDLSSSDAQQANAIFPLSLLFAGFDTSQWLLGLADVDVARAFTSAILIPASKYQIPAIELDKETSKAAVATVFEKVNTGGVPLNVFELLTATFAGDADYFAEHASDFRLNDDWHELVDSFKSQPALAALKSTDLLQAVTLLTTRKRNLESTSERPPAISAKREDILKLQLSDYLQWRKPLEEAFIWAGRFLSDLRILDIRYLPYPPQIVPLATIRVILGADADAIGVVTRLRQWYWCGVLGEQYGSTTETRFARDVEQVPAWALDKSLDSPNTVRDAVFAESRLNTLRSRRSAAYKGIYALQIAQGATDWVKNQQFDLQSHKDLATDVHHVFPQQWSIDNGIDPAEYDSIINKTPLAAETNRAIGGSAPSEYLRRVEAKARLEPDAVDAIIRTHGIDPARLRADDFVGHFEHRKAFLIGLIEGATGKPVLLDVGDRSATEIAKEYDFEADPDDTQDEAS